MVKLDLAHLPGEGCLGHLTQAIFADIRVEWGLGMLDGGGLRVEHHL